MAGGGGEGESNEAECVVVPEIERVVEVDCEVGVFDAKLAADGGTGGAEGIGAVSDLDYREDLVTGVLDDDVAYTIAEDGGGEHEVAGEDLALGTGGGDAKEECDIGVVVVSFWIAGAEVGDVEGSVFIHRPALGVNEAGDVHHGVGAAVGWDSGDGRAAVEEEIADTVDGEIATEGRDESGDACGRGHPIGAAGTAEVEAGVGGVVDDVGDIHGRNFEGDGGVEEGELGAGADAEGELVDGAAGGLDLGCAGEAADEGGLEVELEGAGGGEGGSSGAGAGGVGHQLAGAARLEVILLAPDAAADGAGGLDDGALVEGEVVGVRG